MCNYIFLYKYQKIYATSHRLTTLRSKRCCLGLAIEGCRSILLPLTRPVMQTELYTSHITTISLIFSLLPALSPVLSGRGVIDIVFV